MKKTLLVFCGILALGSCLPQYNPHQNEPQRYQDDGLQQGTAPFVAGEAGVGVGGSGRRPNHGNSQRLPDGCRWETKTVTEIVEEEYTEKKCSTLYRRKCDTKYNTKCTPYTDEECRTVQRRHCDTKYREKCSTKYRNKPEEYTEDVCEDKYERQCTKHWEERGPGDKVWVDDESTCQNLKRTVCNPVRKTRNKKESYRHCEEEPYEDCRNIPERKCRSVTKQTCQEVPYEDCKNEPYRDCKDIHSKRPKEVARRKRIRVCDGGANGYGSNNNNNDDYDYQDYDYGVFDERNGAPDTAKKVEPKPRKDHSGTSSDKIVFGSPQ